MTRVNYVKSYMRGKLVELHMTDFHSIEEQLTGLQHTYYPNNALLAHYMGFHKFDLKQQIFHLILYQFIQHSLFT